MSFEFAPITRGLMVSFAVTSIWAGMFDVKHYLHLQLVPHISRHHQYWRLLGHHLAFSSSSDLFVAEVLLFNIGVNIERQFGSLKYASFAILTFILSTILEFAALLLFHRVGLNYIPAGPIAFIFSLVYQYTRIVPSAYHFRVFGLPLSNKSFQYMLASLLALSRLPGSGLVAVIGLAVGQLYRSDLANIKTYRIPPFLVSIFRSMGPLFGSIRPPRRSNRALPNSFPATHVHNNNGIVQNEEVITTARPSQPTEAATERNTSSTLSRWGVNEWVNEITGRESTPAVRIPSEAEISQAQAMFPSISRDVVVRALQSSANIEGAVESLLAAQR